MSLHPVLLSDQRQVLGQALDLVDGMDIATYTAAAPDAGLASVGEHLRHALDLYRVFLDGVADGRVDYELRERDPCIEQDPAVGVACAREVLRGLAALDDGDAELQVRSDSVALDGEEQPFARSTVERELQFLMSHAIHHFALIAANLRLQGHEPAAGFGIAPSTLRHLRRSDRCAR